MLSDASDIESVSSQVLALSQAPAPVNKAIITKFWNKAEISYHTRLSAKQIEKINNIYY